MQQYQWKGSKPERFSGGKMQHLKPEDELSHNFQPKLSTIGACGIRTFSQKLSDQYQFKPHLKVYPELHQLVTKEIDLKGKKVTVLAQQKQRIRAEKLHVLGGQQTSAQFENRGIKSYGGSTKTTLNEHSVQQNMQKKARILTYQDQRNNLGVTALGDKSYKYPEYCSNFYHTGGLIVGSTFRPMKEKEKQEQQMKKIPVFTKPNWDVVVKMEQVAEDKRVVNSVDDWEKTTLKEANPNWNDPDTFFERMQAKKDQKDVKKGGKK